MNNDMVSRRKDEAHRDYSRLRENEGLSADTVLCQQTRLKTRAKRNLIVGMNIRSEHEIMSQERLLLMFRIKGRAAATRGSSQRQIVGEFTSVFL